jgi:hypothetical protein
LNEKVDMWMGKALLPSLVAKNEKEKITLLEVLS